MNTSLYKLVERNLGRLLPADQHLADYIDFFMQQPVSELWDEQVRGLVTEQAMSSKQALSPEAVELLTEAIILRSGRPGLLVQRDQFNSITPWEILSNYKSILQACIPSVGRITMQAGDNEQVVGTGWVFRGHIITNRHVAAKFYARNPGKPTTFMRLEGDTGRKTTAGMPDRTFYRPYINFRVEAGSPVSREYCFALKLPVHFPGADEPDIAILQVAPASLTGRPLPPSLQLATTEPTVQQPVAIIGHPADDLKRNPDKALLQAFFQGHYAVKRLQPGLLTNWDNKLLYHDCTTTGGNSGSPLLDLSTGEVLGLHSRGEFGRYNSAVPTPVLAAIINDLALPALKI
jgi:endonuclease G